MKGGVALVTGGSRGIGRAIVEALHGEGWTVAFTFRTGEPQARALEAALGATCRAFPLDIQDPPRPGELVRQVEEALGPLEGLVNSAGFHSASLLAMTSEEEFSKSIDVNLGGVFRCCRAALPRMVARRRGSIVNVSSLSALKGLPGQTAYAAAKAGVLGLTRSLAREVGKRGIRVNAVLPGFVETDLTAELDPKIVALLRSTEALPGGTRPKDVAAVVAFLLSDRAAAVTGQAILVDSGSSA